MWIWACLVATLIPIINATGTYSVVAPKVLRPNRDYTVVVSSHGTDDPTRITVQITGNTVGGFVNRQVTELRGKSTQTVKFEIGELSPADYNLTVVGYGAITFRNTTQLLYEPKSYSVFIQTDRGTYQPTDTIQFRALIVNPYLKPSVTGAIDVYVRDGDGNIVKQWLRVFTNKGVFSEKVEISSEPVLGTWTITVNVLGQETSSSVFVAEYVLPKFQVEVDLPQFVTFQDEQIVSTIKARYTHGRPVKGEVTLQVTPTYKYAYLQAPYDKPVSVVKIIKGKTDITLNLFDDLRLREDYIRELQFTAYVREEFTGRVQNATSTITVFRYPYKMTLIRTSDSFKPGLKYTAFLKLSNHDDTPVGDGEVMVKHAFSKSRSDFVEKVHRVPFNGIVPLEFYPPMDQKVMNLAIEAKYGGLTQWLADLTRAQSPSNNFLQVTLLTERPEVGGEVVIGLNSTEPLNEFVYQVLGRGDVIYAETLQARGTHEHVFRFAASYAMAPRARLVVYYVRPDGELVADSLHFTVKGTMQNEVTVSVNPTVADAGQSVAITVTTKPNAFVGISAIDQSSLTLSEGNRLTEDVILNELESYDAGQKNSPSPWHFLSSRSRRNLVSWHGTATANEVFDNSGVLVMTNGNLHSFNSLAGASIPGGIGPVDGSKILELHERKSAINGPFGRPFAPLFSPTVRPDLGPGVVYNSPTRPPLAGPYAFSYLPAPPDDKPRIFLNKPLPEPWLFADATTRFNGVVTIREKVPDSITSYTVSAFGIDDFYGLGVSTRDSEVRVFRPFFISLNVPSPVIQGEAVAIEMAVFNYGKDPVTANVTLFNPGPGDFLFPDFVNEIDQGSPESSRTRTINIPGQSGAPLSFMIVPQKLGSIDIRVSASTTNAVDVVRKQLHVKPRGNKLTINRALLVDLKSEQSFSETVNITTPRNIVEGSLDISVSVIGDIIGPAVEEPESLLMLPKGCGEQNMATMVPNVLLMEYLAATNVLTNSKVAVARRHLQLGYQRQLTFRRDDGSFSAFGKKDVNGSTWLTAFVVQSLALVSAHIDVEHSIIDQAAIWLINNQELDGSFREKGMINNKAVQGGASNGVPLTAYVVIALLNIRDSPIDNLRNAINGGLEFLVNEMPDTKDPYALSILTYALHLASHPLRDAAFYQLEAIAKVKDGKKWWEGEPLQRNIETTVESTSLDIEMTSYALLTYTLRGLVRDSFPLLKWITAQRNQHGGFQSTQDTVVAMTALTSILRLMPSSNPRLEVQIIAGARGDNVLVNNNNAMTLQKREVVNTTDAVTIKARGSGFAVVQVTYSFNVEVAGPAPSFSLDPQLDRSTDKNKLRLTTCTGYIAGNSSNMAVLDVSLPTGYVVDTDLVYSLYKYEGVKKVEKKEMDSGVLIYFDNLTPIEVCPTITAYRVAKVASQKKAPVKIYDYYDLSRSARQFYKPSPATLCDICDLDECDQGQCEEQIIELNRQLQDPADFYYPAYIEDTSSSSKNQIFMSIMTTCLLIILIARF